ncbi:MAG: hypothetical protein JWM80_2874 [Cyanobacteria bacterium RYN_339]|nr:hypothetical protein [Cyanobacteria bacterium RYN_339]
MPPQDHDPDDDIDGLKDDDSPRRNPARGADSEDESTGGDTEEEEEEEEEEEARTYTVKAGDSLSLIAQRELGDADRWGEIHELNVDEVPNPNLIHPGQVLYLPEE